MEGQLSFSLNIPSLSKSSDNISNVIFALSDWVELLAVTSRSYDPETSSPPTSIVTTTVPSSLMVIISLGLYDSVVRDGRLITSNVTSSLKPPLTS